MFKKYEKYIYIFIAVLVVFIIFYGFHKASNAKEVVLEEKIEEKVEVEDISSIKVEIKGAVSSPGVYELDIDSRVIDLINVAGGITEEADISRINQAKKLNDEMVVIIYTKEEIATYQDSLTKYEVIELPCDCPDNSNNACINDYKEVESDTEEKDSKVSINKATVEELMTLTGVGESKANNIIKYRDENGPFEKLEDLQNVSGIGASAYEKIKDFITL